MTYSSVQKATFLARPNRFVANCRLGDDREVVCHVKNTGRCRELLLPGCSVWLAAGENPNRKTAFDLVAVEKGDLLINMDAQAPNQAAAEFLPTLYPDWQLNAEVPFNASRLDFCLYKGDKRLYVEVKGVTLERDGHVYFPDAPTVRGLRHVEELIAARQAGYGAMLLFVVQMKGVHAFSPNMEADPVFGVKFLNALRQAEQAGVELLAYDCIVTPDSMKISEPLPILLSGD